MSTKYLWLIWGFLRTRKSYRSGGKCECDFPTQGLIYSNAREGIVTALVMESHMPWEEIEQRGSAPVVVSADGFTVLSPSRSVPDCYAGLPAAKIVYALIHNFLKDTHYENHQGWYPRVPNKPL